MPTFESTFSTPGMPPHVRYAVDFFGALLFLIPFTIFALVVSYPSIRNSWQLLETSSDPGGLPRYPIKSVILLAFTLLLLQGIVEAWRSFGRLRRARQVRRRWQRRQSFLGTSQEETGQ